MGDLDQILPFLKYGGALLTMVYGIYATVTDFKEDRDGKKVLSLKGYIGIGLLVFSSLLAFCSDAVKDSQDRKEAAAAKAELQQQNRELKEHYESIIADLKQVSGDALRAANPIKDLAFSFAYTLPSDSRLDDYRKRLERERENIKQGRFPKGVSWTYENTEVRIERDSPLFPQPTEVAYELVGSPLVLAFYRAPWDPSDRHRTPDLTCDLTRRGQYNDGRTELLYNIKTGKLQYAWYKITKYMLSSSGRIAAIPELASSELKVRFHDQHFASDSSQRAADLTDLRRAVIFDYLSLSMAGGRSFRVSSRDLKKSADGTGYEYTFPSHVE